MDKLGYFRQRKGSSVKASLVDGGGYAESLDL